MVLKNVTGFFLVLAMLTAFDVVCSSAECVGGGRTGFGFVDIARGIVVYYPLAVAALLKGPKGVDCSLQVLHGLVDRLDSKGADVIFEQPEVACLEIVRQKHLPPCLELVESANREEQFCRDMRATLPECGSFSVRKIFEDWERARTRDTFDLKASVKEAAVARKLLHVSVSDMVLNESMCDK